MPSISNRLSHSTAYAEAITLLIRHGGSVSEISEHSGLGYVTVRKLVHALHAAASSAWHSGAATGSGAQQHGSGSSARDLSRRVQRLLSSIEAP